MGKYIFQTARIGFALWNIDDIDLARSLWGNKDVMRLLSSNGYYTESQISDRLKNEIGFYNEFGIQYWKLYELETSKFIGCCGLKPCDKREHSLELGFQLLPDFWGYGYAHEASAFCLSYALNVLKNENIYAGHHPENMKSSKLLSRLGFTLIDHVHYIPTGLMHPFYQYQIGDHN